MFNFSHHATLPNNRQDEIINYWANMSPDSFLPAPAMTSSPLWPSILAKRQEKWGDSGEDAPARAYQNWVDRNIEMSSDPQHFINLSNEHAPKLQAAMQNRDKRLSYGFGNWNNPPPQPMSGQSSDLPSYVLMAMQNQNAFDTEADQEGNLGQSNDLYRKILKWLDPNVYVKSYHE